MLATFKVKEDSLYKISGTTEVKLNPHSPTEFTAGGGKYTFILDEKGRPKGVRILSSSRVDFWPLTTARMKRQGLIRKSGGIFSVNIHGKLIARHLTSV